MARTGALAVAVACMAFAVTTERRVPQAQDQPVTRAASATGLGMGTASIPSRTAGNGKDAERAILTDAGMQASPPVEDAAGPPCEVTLEAVPAAMWTAVLTIYAPCHAGALATVHHEAIAVTLIIDADGVGGLPLPALRDDATFFVFLPDGAAAMAEATVEGAERQRLVALIPAPGISGRIAHAPDDAEQPKPRDVAGPENGPRVHLELGRGAGAVARVANFFRPPQGEGAAGILVEIDVDETSCGREAEVLVLRADGSGSVQHLPLVAPMPACDEIGTVVVLNAVPPKPILEQS